jgi:hypothetical protein
MASIETPVLKDHGGYDGLMYNVGPDQIFIFDIEENADQYGRTVMIGHDEDGDEVEIRFHPKVPVCIYCGNDADDEYEGDQVCDSCIDDLENPDEAEDDA